MTANPHPLDPATAGEYLAGREVMAAGGLLTDPVRFPHDAPADRGRRAFLLNVKTGESPGVVVSLPQGSVVSARTVDTAAEGQLPIIASKNHLVEEMVC